MFLPRLLLLNVLLLCTCKLAGQTLYEVERGRIDINSNAPHEIIQAVSKKLKGLINVEKKQFAFAVEVATFEGFNSPLQREHFNENYMESFLYPQITFTGKIIEDIDLSEDGDHRVRAKGKLDIHGVSNDRIIYADVHVKNGEVNISSDFKVMLADHNIKIPRIVNDKLAKEVSLEVHAELKKKE